MAITASVIGSSFVARLSSYISDCDECENFGFEYCNVDATRVWGRGGLRATQLFETYSHPISHLRPDLLICQIGGNDLARSSASAVYANILDFARTCISSYGVQHFVILSTLPRFCTEGRETLKFGISEGEFLSKSMQLNRLLAANFNTDSLHFWELRTLTGPQIGLGYICSDGVHLNTEGMYRYYYQIRGAILKYSKRMLESWGHWY